MVTLESIEEEVADNFLIRRAMNNVVNKLKKVEKDVGPEIIKDLILGRKVLNPEQYGACREKYGIKGLRMIEAMENLNTAQKQYLFKRMGYPIEEVN